MRAPVLCALAICLSALSGLAQARPLTLEDVLQSQAFGQIAIAPGGRWVVAENLAPYASAPRFDFDGYPQPVLGRLWRVDLERPGHARPLLSFAPGAGYRAGPFSPSGRLMVVYRLIGRAWDTGIVDLASGRTRWLGLPALEPLYGRSCQWASEHQLIMIALPRGELPQRLRQGWQAQDRHARLWREAAQGRRPTVSLAGSGAFADIGHPPTRERLVRVDLNRGAVHTLAEGAFLDMELSADRRFVAALREADLVQPRASEPVRIGQGERRRALTLVDLTNDHASAPCPACDVLTDLLSWAPGSDQLLIYARAPGQTWAQGALVAIQASTGQVHPLGYGTPGRALTPQISDTAGGMTIVHAAWLNGAPLILARPDADRAGGGQDRLDWYWVGPDGPVNLSAGLGPGGAILLGVLDSRSGAPGQAAIFLAGGAIWRADPSGTARRLTPDLGLQPLANPDFGLGERFSVNPPAAPSVILAAGPHVLVRIGEPPAAEVLPVGADGAPIAAARKDLIVRRADARGVETLTLQRPSGQSLTLVRLNRRLADVEPAEIREIDHTGPRGEALKSWLYLPPRHQQGVRLPLIVLPYPGAVLTHPPDLTGPGAPGFVPNPQLLAAQGYAILEPSLPRDRSSGDPAAGLADQILKVVDRTIAKGDINPDRLALWGHSFGGYAALVVATQTTRFKAIIAASAPADLAGVWGAIPAHNRMVHQDGYPTTAMMGWVETGQAGLGGAPWTDPARYVRNSPFYAADKITTPVLLIYGDQDFAPLAQGEAMFAALYRQDKDAALMTLWGEGHTPSSPANIRAVYDQALDWLRRTL